MQTLLATFLLLLLAMLAMAVGVLFGSRRLQGSCGGQPGKDCSCSTAKRKACEKPPADHRRPPRDDAHVHLDVLGR